jgi:tetratricopeptide (TPR) repeat protein
MEPENKTYLDTYAWILFVKGKIAEAKVYIDKVVAGEIDKDERVTAGVLEHAGDIYFNCGDVEKALYYWEKALEKGGEDTSPLLRRKIKTRKYVAP